MAWTIASTPVAAVIAAGNAPLLDGDTAIYPPVSRPVDFVEFTALADLIVCLSACPQDMADTNGLDREPRDDEVAIT